MYGESSRSKLTRASLWSIGYVFFKIGLLTFGGGFAMLPVLTHELRDRRQWMTDKELADIVSAATVFPGAISVNCAFLQGLRMRGIPGMAAAVTGLVTPSLLVILLIAIFLSSYAALSTVQAFFKGAAAAVTAQIAYAVYIFGQSARPTPRAIGLALAILALLIFVKIHPMVAILVSGSVGFFLFGRRRGPSEEPICRKDG